MGMNQNNEYNEISKWETHIVKDWRRQFEHIRKEAVCLVRNKHTYVEVRNIIARNDTARKPSKFHSLFTEGYIALSLLRVRRLCSETKGDISLRNLFKDMKRHNHEVSLDRFIRLYIEDSDDKQFDREEAIRIFEEICGRGNKVLPISVIRKHESKLIENTQLITNYATKFYAHRSNEDIDKIPIFGDLDKAIDEIEAVIMNYSLLLKGSRPLSLFPEPQYNWKQIFYQAWLPKQKDIKV